jgi:outer membrane protein OmpA-like peptidoglycan-associated protein
MKTFKEFLSECYFVNLKYLTIIFEGQYSDEDAFRKVWNHFITHKKYGSELRTFLQSKDFDGAREYMENEIENAKNDPKHPLSFDKAKRGFKGGKTSSDIGSYFDMMKMAPDSIVAFVKGRRGSNTAKRISTYARVSGGAKPPTSAEWQNETGKSSDTSKRDIEFVDPKNKKYGLGLSLKMGKGSQTISAEPDEAYATFQNAGKEYIKKMKKNGASKEEIEAFQSQLNKTSEKVRKVLGFTSSEMTPKVNKELSDRRISLVQRSIDNLFQDHPKFISDFDREGAEGKAKFGKTVSSLPDENSPQVRAAKDALRIRNGEIDVSDFKSNKNDSDEDKAYKKLVRDLSRSGKKILNTLKSSPSGSAQEVVTGTNVDTKGNVIARAKSVPVSQRGRTTPETGPSASAPKGMTADPDVSRPANVKLRVSGSQEPKSNQAQPQQGPITYQTYERRKRISQLKQSISSRQETEPEDPLAKEKERIAKLPIHRQAQALRNAVGARMRVQQAQQQSQQLVQREPQQQVQPPTQPQTQATQQNVQPSIPQPVEDPTKKKKPQSAAQRMDAAAQRLGYQ